MDKSTRRRIAAVLAFLVAAAMIICPDPVSAGTLTSATWTTSTPYVSAPQSTYNYGFTTATTATLGSVRMTMPTGTTGATRYLDLNGTNGNYASTPDSVANSVTGDIDIRVKAALANWTPAGANMLIGKAQSSTTRSFKFYVKPSGTIELDTSADGSTVVGGASTVAPTVSNGASIWLRATLQVNDGSGNRVENYYTSADGTTWTQLGTTLTTAGTTSIFDSTSQVEIGSSAAGTSNTASGAFYYADVRNSIQGTSSASGCSTTAVQVCFNANDDLPGASSWTSSSTQQEVWTVNRSGTNLPADIAAGVTVSANTGIGAGTAKLRQIDGQIYYFVTSPASVPALTPVSLSIGGIINSQKRGNQTSTITTYDTTPSTVDSATTGNLLFVNAIATVSNTCMLSASGSPKCWGPNQYSQVADGTTNSAVQPTAPSGGPYTWSDISVGSYHGCGLNSVGAAYCWGMNWGGGIGDGTTIYRTTPTPVSGGLTFAELSGGGNVTSCGVTTAGAGYCWGNNGNGEVGDGTTTNRNVPTAVSGGLTWSAIETGTGATTCGLTTSGAAYCWGAGSSGQIGNGATNQQTTPTAVSGGLTFASLSVGASGACGITPSAIAYCWGANPNGQLGDGTTVNKSIPTPVSGGYTFADISQGSGSTCAVTTSGAAYCWGLNGTGQVGDGTFTQRTVPTAVGGGHTFVQISAGNNVSCGITNDTATYCWGGDDDDRLGSATIPINSLPVAVSGGLSFASVSIGTYFACGVTVAGAGYCWGNNGNGEIGDGTSTNRLAPTAVSGGYTWSTITTGDRTACGITTTNVTYCWGYNSNGQVGDGSTSARNVPTAVSGGLTFTNLSVGQQYTCGVTNTNAAYCWGANGNGQFGDGTTNSSTTPTPVSGSLSFANISVPTIGQTTCGVTTGNIGYCWGLNSSGQVGIGNTTQQTSPAAVSGGLSFSYISPGGAGATAAQTCGVTTSGAEYCWGSNVAGVLGSGNTTSFNTPHGVVGGITFGTSTTSISTGTWQSCGVSSTNVGYCWGYNGSGRLGDATLTARNSPTLIGGGLSLTSISAGQFATCGLTTSHTAYCWGNNDYGQLGNGASGMTSTPEFVDNAPTQSGITQTKTTSSVISTGGWTNETSVLFTATLTDPDTEMADSVALCIEVEPLGTQFANTGTCTSPVVSSGSLVTYTASSLVDGTQYHWQYRTQDSESGYSPWTQFNSGAIAFGVDTTAPSPGSVNLTTTSSLSSASGSWSGFTDASSGTPSGLGSYSYALGTTSGGTDVLGWTSNGTSTSATINSLSLRTSQPYYLSVEETDIAGNVSSAATSQLKLVAPSASFSSTAPTNIRVTSGGSASLTFNVTTSTNAYGGYQIYAFLPSDLTYNGSTISDFSGGTWASPNDLSTGTGFGYTSSDTSVSGSNRFQAATCPGGTTNSGTGCYAAFTSSGPGDVIADNNGPVTGTPVTNETFTITLNVSVSSSQAGGTYLSQIHLAPVFSY